MSSHVRPSPRLWPWWLAAAGLACLAGACSKHGGQAAASLPAPAPISADSRAGQVIAQARAALAPESKLLSVQSLVFTGKIFDDKDQPLGTIQLVFKRPARMRSETQTAQNNIIECSDGEEGWMLITGKNKGYQFDILKGPQETQDIYTTLENLYFYRGAELVRGSEVTAEGPVTYRNKPCMKLSFHYPDNLTFVRYLDQTTGELRGTVVLPTGVEFVGEGQRTASGINFPALLHSYSSSGVLVQTVKFESILVNPTVDDRMFAMPSIMDLRAAAAKAAATAKPAPTPGSTPAAQPLPSLPTATK